MGKINKNTVLKKWGHLFEKGDIEKFFITDDGQVFLPSAIDYLRNHCRRSEVGYSVITISDFENFKQKSKDEKAGKDEKDGKKAENKK